MRVEMMGESASIRLVVKEDRASHRITDEKCQHLWLNTIRWYVRQHEVHVSVDDFNYHYRCCHRWCCWVIDDTFYEIFVQITVTLFSVFGFHFSYSHVQCSLLFAYNRLIFEAWSTLQFKVKHVFRPREQSPSQPRTNLSWKQRGGNPTSSW